MKKRLLCMLLVCLFVIMSMPTIANAASCKRPAYNYMTLYFTGERHSVKSRFTGIKIHSGNTVMNNEVTNTTEAYSLLRATNDNGKWHPAVAKTDDASTSSYARAYTTPVLRYVTKGKATCKVHCDTCNKTVETGTGEQYASDHTDTIEFSISL